MTGTQPTHGGILGTLMTGGVFQPGTAVQPTRLTITPSPPARFRGTLPARAGWGWTKTHPHHGWDDEIVRRVGPVEGRAPVRTEFTPSEIQAFDWCDMLHFWRYRKGLETTTIDLRRAGDPLTATQLGTALHWFVATYREDVGLEETLRRAVQGQDPRARIEAEVERLRPAAEYHLASALEARVRASDEQQREIPFSMELDEHERVYLEGRYDLIFRERDAWTIVDYKSTSIPSTDGSLGEWALREEARRYEAQLAVYAIVLEQVMGRRGNRVTSCVLAFPHARAEVELLVTEEWLEGWRRLVLEYVRRMRAGLYSRQRTYNGSRCSGCPMLRICRPERAPE